LASARPDGGDEEPVRRPVSPKNPCVIYFAQGLVLIAAVVVDKRVNERVLRIGRPRARPA
jgi:hypothetical protein